MPEYMYIDKILDLGSLWIKTPAVAGHVSTHKGVMVSYLICMNLILKLEYQLQWSWVLQTALRMISLPWLVSGKDNLLSNTISPIIRY